MPDQKLTEVREKIAAILKENDVTGIVVLGSRTHCNFLQQLEASWSACYLEHDKDKPEMLGIRLRCLRKDYPSREAQGIALRDTIGMLMGHIDTLTAVREQLQAVIVMAAQNIGIEHMTKYEGPI